MDQDCNPLPFSALHPNYLPICLHLIAWRSPTGTKPPVSNKITLYGISPCISASCVAKNASIPCSMLSHFQLYTLSTVWSPSCLWPDCHQTLPDWVLDLIPWAKACPSRCDRVFSPTAFSLEARTCKETVDPTWLLLTLLVETPS